MEEKKFRRLVIFTPIAIAIWVWNSSLVFVPIPWPDDSAFYFAAKDFFAWPPRWVMLSQAPFEPTYQIFSFNTMPLYPILIGLGRWIGIDGTFNIKFWPLFFWAFSGSLLGVVLHRARIPRLFVFIFTLGFALNPILRWASVLVRPESLVGLCGLCIVLGMTLGFPRSLRARKLWDPISALLAIGAYAHFNAIHLLFPLVLTHLKKPKQLISIGLKTALYLLPWFITVAIYPVLFVKQMTLQWHRLSFVNPYFSGFKQALDGLFQSMGSPEGWPSIVFWVAGALWFIVLLSFAQVVLKTFSRFTQDSSIDLTPAAAWVLGSIWLWYTKPEAWYVYFIHAATWTFLCLAALKTWHALQSKALSKASQARILWRALLGFVAGVTAIYGYIDVSQYFRLDQTQTWHESTYTDFINCIDEQLIELEKKLDHPKLFRVWVPVYPDITVGLSVRHPEWSFTRSNDFYEREKLAIQHGYDVEAVVVAETIQPDEINISGPASQYPQIQSLWMTYKGFYLNHFLKTPDWKPNRYVCIRGRWRGFLFMK